MKNFLKSGRVVIILNGRYAGRKGVIIKSFMSGTSERPYSHAIVAGVDRYPRKITKSMNKEKVRKRSRVKGFIKSINMNHLFPTRFTFDFKLKKETVDAYLSKSKRNKRTAKIRVGEIMQRKHDTGENKFFFTKLRF